MGLSAVSGCRALCLVVCFGVGVQGSASGLCVEVRAWGGGLFGARGA